MGQARLLAVLAGALCVGGCALHTTQVPQVAPSPPARYAEATPDGPGAEEEPPRRWWLTFGDPELDQLMVQAFEGNLDLARGYARLEQFLATARIAGAATRPVLTAGAKAGRDRQPGLTGDTTTSDYRFSLTAGYELDLWQKLDARTRAAQLDAEASREDLLALYLTLSSRVADVYYLVREQGAQLELTDATIASFEDALVRVERRYRAGLVPSLDVYQARQNLSAARARRAQYDKGLALARHALAELLGEYTVELSARDAPHALLPAPPPLPPTGVPADLLTRRPDLRAAFADLRASDARVAAAVADRFPSLRFTASGGAARTVLEAGTLSGVFWGLLAELAQPVVDGGRRKAEVERSEAVFRERAAVYRQTVLRAFREVEDALVANRTAAERIARLETLVGETEAGLRAASQRYLQGLSDYLPVITAQTRHFDAQSTLLSARAELLAGRVALVRALGGDWMDDALAAHYSGAEPDSRAQPQPGQGQHP